MCEASHEKNTIISAYNTLLYYMYIICMAFFDTSRHLTIHNYGVLSEMCESVLAC